MEQHEDIGTKWDLAQYRVETARNDLWCSKKLLEMNECRSANNRAYYAIYHGISAVHAIDGNVYRKHKDAIANFNKNYINKEIFPKEYGRKIVNAEKIRASSDYDDFYIASKEVTKNLIETAQELLKLIVQYLESRK